jgi:hypothetical protein
MIQIGQFRFALVPEADENAFLEKTRNDFPQALTSTRITTGFEHTLMKGPVAGQYVWQAKADLMTEAGYDFPGVASQIQETIGNEAVLIGVEIFTEIG